MFKRMLWAMFRPEVERWVSNRAFKISAKKRPEVQKQFHLTEEQLQALEATFAANAITELDRFWEK